MDQNNNEQLDHKRHTLAHLLAAAVLELYPDAKPTIGPTVDNGFYYDFEFSKPIAAEDLKDIEKRMRKILPSWKEMKGQEVSADEARKFFKDNPYKLELIEEIATKNEPVSIYTAGPSILTSPQSLVPCVSAISAVAVTVKTLPKKLPPIPSNFPVWPVLTGEEMRKIKC